MAKILTGSIDLNKVPKEKIIKGKKGNYLNVSVVINDEKDQYDNDGFIAVQQSEEERKNKDKKVYLGNVRIVWTNENSQPEVVVEDDDLPF